MAVEAYPADLRRIERGSIGPYLQQQPGKPIFPPWASDKVGNYARRGAAYDYAISGLYSLWRGLSFPAMAANILVGTVAGFAFWGLVRLGYNVLKHYVIRPSSQPQPR